MNCEKNHWHSLSDDLESKTRRITGDSNIQLSENELQSLALVEIESILRKKMVVHCQNF